MVTGGITAVTQAGTAPTDVGSFPNVTANTAGASGNGLSLDVVRDGTSGDSSVGTYSISLNNAGSGYNPADKVKFDAESLGGQAGVHDIEVLVESIDSAGAVVTFTYR